MGYGDIWHIWDWRWKNAELNGKHRDVMCIYVCIHIYMGDICYHDMDRN